MFFEVMIKKIAGKKPAKIRTEIFKNSCTIGRTHGDLLIEDKRISRVHLRITHSHDGLVLSDLNSANGTEVNGHKVGYAKLEVGTEIQIGSSVICVIAIAKNESTTYSSDIVRKWPDLYQCLPPRME